MNFSLLYQNLLHSQSPEFRKAQAARVYLPRVTRWIQGSSNYGSDDGHIGNADPMQIIYAHHVE